MLINHFNFDFELVCLANQKILIQPIKIEEKKTKVIAKVIGHFFLAENELERFWPP